MKYRPIPFPSSHGHVSSGKSLEMMLPYLWGVVQKEILEPGRELKASSLAPKLKNANDVNAVLPVFYPCAYTADTLTPSRLNPKAELASFFPAIKKFAHATRRG